jgi:hypothetical protein
MMAAAVAVERGIRVAAADGFSLTVYMSQQTLWHCCCHSHQSTAAPMGPCRQDNIFAKPLSSLPNTS